MADEALGNVRTVRAFAMETKENEWDLYSSILLQWQQQNKITKLQTYNVDLDLPISDLLYNCKKNKSGYTVQYDIRKISIFGFVV